MDGSIAIYDQWGLYMYNMLYHCFSLLFLPLSLPLSFSTFLHPFSIGQHSKDSKQSMYLLCGVLNPVWLKVHCIYMYMYMYIQCSYMHMYLLIF